MDQDGLSAADYGSFLADWLRTRVPSHQHATWFRDFRVVRAGPGEVLFAVPNAFIRDWIENYYADILRDGVAAGPGGPRPFRIVTADDPDAASLRADASSRNTAARHDSVRHDSARDDSARHDAPGGTPPAAPAAPAPSRPVRRTQPAVPAPAQRGGMRGQLFGHPRYANFRSDVLLNDQYVFDQFVSGPSNQLAHAAAQAVANHPAFGGSSQASQGYNPLFLHGSVGLGKSHLLQAICHQVLSRRPDTRILYLSCETFVNQFISAVEAGELEDFRYRYRHVDMLLIDDIHFLARKERTQEEFFHTFNQLYNSGKQIVLSCDSPPREIPTLEDRLVSRFKWGLVTEIEQPDTETRVSIVQRKARGRGAELPPEIASFIADNVTQNVRELEGAVNRVLSFALLRNQPVSMEIAEEALRDHVKPRERKVTLETILRAVCEHFGIKPSDLTGKRRHKSVTMPRHVCMYLARQMTECSLVEVGGFMGGRDHTTVLYACDRIVTESAANPRLREDLDAIVRKIRSGR